MSTTQDERGGLRGKVALVTGGGSGIGAATAELLAGAGVKVAILGTTQRHLDEVSGRIQTLGGECLTLSADVSDMGAMTAACGAIISQWQQLDIVVANAGINGVWAPLDEITCEEWDRAFAVNARGTFLTLRSALPHLKVRGGSVVVVASINGSRLFSNPGASAYASSKASQVALAKMAAVELARNRIRVNVVCPGSIETRIEQSMERRHLEKISSPKGENFVGIPLTNGQPGSARQVADLIAFLASDLASHITGTEVYIDGGETLVGG